MKRILPLILGLLVLSVSAVAQSKGETSLYGKTLKKPTVKAAEKFLNKYPESVYAPKVVRLRDSLVYFGLDPEDASGVKAFCESYPDSPFLPLANERIRQHNTSRVSHEQALKQAGNCLDAIGWRKDNVEHILALDTDLQLRILTPEGDLQESRSIPVYTLADNPASPTLVLPMDLCAPLGRRQYVHFAYLNGDAEYVEVLYLPEEDLLNQALFYGTPQKPADGERFRIEGQSPEAMEGLTLSPEVAWIVGRFQENSALVPLSKADLLTDASIQWWLQKNPKAETTATKLVFGQLDPESSLVAAYKKARKEKGKNSSAALFDIRGYTVICTAKNGEYNLVWCEPVCKNKKKDKYISTIYFENDGTTLDLCYYKGNTTFKLKISLLSQSLKHLK